MLPVLLCRHGVGGFVPVEVFGRIRQFRSDPGPPSSSAAFDPDHHDTGYHSGDGQDRDHGDDIDNHVTCLSDIYAVGEGRTYSHPDGNTCSAVYVRRFLSLFSSVGSPGIWSAMGADYGLTDTINYSS